MEPVIEGVGGPLVVTDHLVIPAGELSWRFSRSSGPGGQGVNTTDSRAEVRWSPSDSAAVTTLGGALRDRLLARLESSLVNGAIVIAASEYRTQLRNREAARQRLVQLLRRALAPPPRHRRPTRPTRGSVERRLQAKQARARTKAERRRPRED